MARSDDEPRKTVPPDAPANEASGATDMAGDDASKEAAFLGQGKSIRDLQKEAAEAEHGRSQAFKNHFELLSIIMLYVLFAGFILLATVWVLHMLLPERVAGLNAAGDWWSRIHGWLNKDQVDKVAGVLAGGVIAGLVADHFKRRMG